MSVTPEEIEARVDGILPQLATKTDLADAELRIIRWMVGTIAASALGGITIMTFVLNNAVPKPVAATTAPIVIVVPKEPT